MVCDGAKSSCAGKIASAVEAGLLAYSMAKDGKVYGEDVYKRQQHVCTTIIITYIV